MFYFKRIVHFFICRNKWRYIDGVSGVDMHFLKCNTCGIGLSVSGRNLKKFKIIERENDNN